MTNEDIKSLEVGDAVNHFAGDVQCRFVIREIEKYECDDAGNVAIFVTATRFSSVAGVESAEVAFASDNFLDAMGVALWEECGGASKWVGARRRIAGTTFADAMRQSKGKGVQLVPQRTAADLASLSDALVAKGLPGFCTAGARHGKQ